MYSIVPHGTWLPEPQLFFLWGETVVQRRRTGRQPAVPRHPFQADANDLQAWVNRHVPNAASINEHTLLLWLPTRGTAPVPSPHLLTIGAPPGEAGALALAPWRVTGIALPLAVALDLVLALTPATSPSPDLQSWRAAALLAYDLISRQAVVPSLHRRGRELRAAWTARPDPLTAQQIAVLAHRLPPLCRAASATPADAPAPQTLLMNFLDASVDHLVRVLADCPASGATSPGGRWITALLGSDPIVRLPGPAADALYQAWERWASPAVETTRPAGNDVFRICFRVEPPDASDQGWTLTYLLQATDDPSLLVSADQIWHETGPALRYLDRRFDQPQERLLAGLGYAARVFPPLSISLRQATPSGATLTTAEAFHFLSEAAPVLEQRGFGIIVPSWWQGGAGRLRARAHVKTTPAPKNEHGVLSFERLVSFTWELAVGDEPLDRAEFERLVALKQPLVQVRGQWVALDVTHIDQILTLLQREGTMTLGDAVRMGLGGDASGAPAGIELAGLTAEGWLQELLERLSHPERIALLAAPATLGGTLRPYQIRGFSWLVFLRRLGAGACLADDMGLGKSIQTMALLLQARAEGTDGPALIVSPTSVVANWQREIQRFAPSLRVMIHQGADRQSGATFAKAAALHDVVLTSFPLLARDHDTLRGVAWDTVVLDEAQNIKNPAAKQAQAARTLTARHRVALTGTPVENRLSELWSIMHFLNPGYLGNEATFRRTFARPIERDANPEVTDQLRRLTTPLVLRRVKTDPTVISDLPQKLEMNVYCTLSREQATLYEAVVQEALRAIEHAEHTGSAIKRRGQVLAMLMKLKQVCNHPAQLLKDGSALPGRSGKLTRLVEMLEEVYAESDRALIFTQFAEMGGLLQQHLRETFHDDVLFLHGGTPAKERDAQVRRFQAPHGPRVFILSLKAGGTGLNLTAANHVFHFDRWWNPAVENQATDRAYRIGQTRNVQVHTFLCGGTLEEHIDELITSKRALAASVLGTSEGWLTELSSADLRDLVTLRRDALVEE